MSHYANIALIFEAWQRPLADMQTQVISGASKWAVRANWQPLSRGWKFDKKSQFVDLHP
jgi:hypothetical protein